MGVRASSFEVLAAKQAITEVLHQYCRAMDRMDRALAISCWHPDGLDQHSGLFSGLGRDWALWVEGFHAPMLLTRHCVSNILIEVDGDQAWSECYRNSLLRTPTPDGHQDYTGGGRYLDHFRCVDGVWAISHRRTVNEWHRLEPIQETVDFIQHLGVELKPAPVFTAARSLQDPSYDFLGGHRTGNVLFQTHTQQETT